MSAYEDLGVATHSRPGRSRPGPACGLSSTIRARRQKLLFFFWSGTAQVFSRAEFALVLAGPAFDDFGIDLALQPSLVKNGWRNSPSRRKITGPPGPTFRLGADRILTRRGKDGKPISTVFHCTTLHPLGILDERENEMPSIKRIIGVALSSLTLTAAGFATAPAASATVGQKVCGSGFTSPGLCIQEYSNGYNISYTNNMNTYFRADFNLVCSDGTYGDQGAFIIGPYRTYTYFFAVGTKNWCQGKLISLTDGGFYMMTPALYG